MLLFLGIFLPKLYLSPCTLDLLRNLWIGSWMENIFMETGFYIFLGKAMLIYCFYVSKMLRS